MSMAPPPESSERRRTVGDVMIPRVARVRRTRRDAPSVWTLELDSDGDTPDLRFRPGQFNMLTIFGVGEIPISFSGNPAAPDRHIHTVRSVGAVSTALTRLEPGAPLGVRGPFGTGWPLEAALGRDVVLVAGGLGLAPLRPMLYHLLAERPRYGKIVLVYGARSPTDILYRRQLESWRRRRDCEIEVTVDHADTTWHGHVGTVTTLLPHVDIDPLDAIAFVCGPEVMMRFAIATLRDTGLDEGSIYLSMERNMKCAVGFCGHCQFGPTFVCRDGPVFPYSRIANWLALKEL